jgi:chemotaxis protein MotB
MRRKAKAAKAENHERWLLTYADLITLLLVFFIVLYAGSQEDSKKFAILAEGLRSAFRNPAMEGGGGNSAVFTGSGTGHSGGMQQQLQDFDSVAAVMERLAQERGLADRINVRMEEDKVVIALTSDLLFASGGSQIRPSAAPVLDAVADALRGRPNEVRIEGHTDNIPINTSEFNSNWELSAARATAVLRYLVDEAHLPPGRLFAAAYGDTRPRADNATAEGRAANRRAEIVVLYPPGGTPPASPQSPAPSSGHGAPATGHGR